MKQFAGLMLLVLIHAVLSGCSTLLRPDENGALIVAPYRNGIVLDGKLNDWKGIGFYEVTPENGVFDLEDTRANGPDDLCYKFALCHDEQALYVAVEVIDDKIITDNTEKGDTNAQVWKDDAIEIFIDGNHNHSPNARYKGCPELKTGGEFSLAINGAATSFWSGWPDSFGKSAYWEGIAVALKENDRNVLRYECRLTWKVMGGNIKPGDTIGFTIGVQDDDDGGERDHALYWKAVSPLCWKNEGGWGDALLERKK